MKKIAFVLCLITVISMFGCSKLGLKAPEIIRDTETESLTESESVTKSESITELESVTETESVTEAETEAPPKQAELIYEANVIESRTYQGEFDGDKITMNVYVTDFYYPSSNLIPPPLRESGYTVMSYEGRLGEERGSKYNPKTGESFTMVAIDRYANVYDMDTVELGDTKYGGSDYNYEVFPKGERPETNYRVEDKEGNILHTFEEDLFWAYMTEDGVIQCIESAGYDDSDKNRIYLSDIYGNEISPHVENIGWFDNGVAAYWIDGKMGLLGNTGEIIFEADFPMWGNFKMAGPWNLELLNGHMFICTDDNMLGYVEVIREAK